jgi:hypothetical protein
MIVSGLLVLWLLSLGSTWRCLRWRASKLERKASPRIDVRRALARSDGARMKFETMAATTGSESPLEAVYVSGSILQTNPIKFFNDQFRGNQSTI